jgi:hypothetical protein
VHGAENVSLCRLAHGVLLVIREEDHIFTGVSEVLVKVCGHVLDIINASSQLALLAEVVNSNQQCLSLAGTARVLEAIALRGTMSECHRITGRSSWAATSTSTLGIVVCYGIIGQRVSGERRAQRNGVVSEPGGRPCWYICWPLGGC